jgi:DNA-binding response OmpR family regulator
MSGCADDLIKQYALEAGAAGFLSKPLRISTLLATIKTIQEQLNPV